MESHCSSNVIKVFIVSFTAPESKTRPPEAVAAKRCTPADLGGLNVRSGVRKWPSLDLLFCLSNNINNNDDGFTNVQRSSKNL